jgi:hypothetical protein
MCLFKMWFLILLWCAKPLWEPPTIIQTARLLPSQSNGQAYSLVNRHRVANAGSFYTLQSPLGCLNFNTGASQPVSATSALPPIGSHSAQRKWNKILASAGQVSQSTSTTPLSTRERHISSSLPVRPAERSDRQYQQQLRPQREFITAAAPHLRGQQLYAQ